MKPRLLIFFVIVTLLITSTLSVSAASVEVDSVCVVYSVIDGDTFDAFPTGRVRLADIDAPDSGSGSTEARNFLNSQIGQKLVYLNVDDVGVIDSWQRLVCVVYVRYNQTHLFHVGP